VATALLSGIAGPIVNQFSGLNRLQHKGSIRSIVDRFGTQALPALASGATMIVGEYVLIGQLNCDTADRDGCGLILD
jgi:hypothetical protein